MPIYEYRCRHCHRAFEQIVLSRGETVACPGCGSADIERQVSLFASIGAREETAPSRGGCSCTPQTCGCR